MQKNDKRVVIGIELMAVNTRAGMTFEKWKTR